MRSLTSSVCANALVNPLGRGSEYKFMYIWRIFLPIYADCNTDITPLKAFNVKRKRTRGIPNPVRDIVRMPCVPLSHTSKRTWCSTRNLYLAYGIRSSRYVRHGTVVYSTQDSVRRNCGTVFHGNGYYDFVIPCYGTVLIFTILCGTLVQSHRLQQTAGKRSEESPLYFPAKYLACVVERMGT